MTREYLIALRDPLAFFLISLRASAFSCEADPAASFLLLPRWLAGSNLNAACEASVVMMKEVNHNASNVCGC
jgi:hypothetical protein